MAERLVLATANPGKVAELTRLLGHQFDVEARPEAVPETIEDAPTLEGNAHKKAIEITNATGAAALSDDTGLFVTHLGDRPGVWTARYAGENATAEDNIEKLLLELEGASDRSAQFRTCMTITWPGGQSISALGVVDGTIAPERQGDRGFGYDPVFQPDDGDGRTFAQMSIDEKGEISHRSRALNALLQMLMG